MNYKIKWCSNAVYFEFMNTITIDKSVNGIKLLLGDSRYDKIKYQFVNFCNIDTFNLTEKEITLLTFLTKLPSKWNKDLHIIFISSKDHISSFLKEYCIAMEKLGIRIELVSSTNKAKQYLRKKEISSNKCD